MLDLEKVLEQAHLKAKEACELNEVDFNLRGLTDACGFAWVDIDGYEGKKIRKNSKIGKQLVELGFLSYRGFQYWNPAKSPTQRISSLEAGAEAAAKVLKEHGFTCYTGSRLD